MPDNIKNKTMIGYLFILYGIVQPISLSATNIFLGLIILSGLALVFSGKERVILPDKRLLSLFFLLFSWSALSRLLSGSPLDKEAFSNIWEYSPIILFPLFLSVSNIRKEAVVTVLLSSSSLVCLLGILQYMVPSIVYPFPRQLVNPDFIGFFSHHLHTGGFFSVTTIVSFALVLFWKPQGRTKAYLWTFFILNLAALVLTMARSYYISVFAVLLALLSIKNIKWLIAGGIFSALIFSALMLFPNPVKARVNTLFDPSYRSNKERVMMWEAAIDMAKDHPIAGVGKGNWKKEAKEYYFPKIEKKYNYDIQAFAHAHNTYLTLLAETGIIGLAIFLSFWLLTVRLIFSGAKKAETGAFDYALRAGTLGGLGNLFVAGMFENNFGTSVILLLITLLVGMSLSVPIAKTVEV